MPKHMQQREGFTLMLRIIGHLSFLCFALLISASLHARCLYPQDVVIPDGTTASYEEMNNAQAAVKQYMADMEAYLDCLERQEANAQLQQQAMVTDPTLTMTNTTNIPLERERNSALNAMEEMATRFNEQVRAFKMANP